MARIQPPGGGDELTPELFRTVRGLAEGVINVLSYGADPTGVTDSAAAFQAAIDDLVDQGTYVGMPMTLFVPGGDYLIGSTLTWAGAFGTKIIGGGALTTRLLWIGSTGQPMVKMVNCRQCTFEGFWMQSGYTFPGIATSAMIEVETNNLLGNPFLSTQNNFRDLQMWGQEACVDGFRISTGAGAANNGNDFHSFDRVIVYDCTQSAWHSSSGQQKGAAFRECLFGGTSPVGVKTSQSGGSFVFTGGFMYGCTTANFHLDSVIDPILIDRFDAESSARLILYDSATANHTPIGIYNTRWTPDLMHADRYFMVLGGAGPFDFHGNQFGWSDSVSPRIKLLYQGPGILNMGSAFESEDSVDDDPIELPVDSQWHINSINTYRTNGASRTMAFRPNELGLRSPRIRTVTTSDDVEQLDATVLVDATLGAVTLSLPAAADYESRIFHFKKTDSSINAMVIDAAGSDLIDGAGSVSTTLQYQSFTLLCDGTGWHIL